VFRNDAREGRAFLIGQAVWRREPFPGKFDNLVSQCTPGSGPVSRGLGSILTYKEDEKDEVVPLGMALSREGWRENTQWDLERKDNLFFWRCLVSTATEGFERGGAIRVVLKHSIGHESHGRRSSCRNPVKAHLLYEWPWPVG